MVSKKVVIISTDPYANGDPLMIDAVLDMDSGKITSWVPRIKNEHKSDS